MPHVTNVSSHIRGEALKSMLKKQKQINKTKTTLCSVVVCKLMAILKTLPGTESILGHSQNEQATFTRKHIPKIPLKYFV